jgi:hypothetical protein
MASQGALGDLVLALHADTTTFQSDLGKAARVAEKELQKVVVIGSAVGTAIGEALVRGTQALIRFGTEAVRFQSQLDDLADTVGGNVTQLDSLRRVAVVSGNDIGQVANAMNILSRSLRASSDEGASAVRAVKALGLDLERLRSMAPADAVKTIATAMNGFADGGGKAAVAMALFGREGAKLLPFLKDLAEQGEVQGKVTKEQAEQAERLEKELRRMGLAFTDVRDRIANAVIPVFGDLLEQFREGIRLSGSFFGALKMLGTINPLKSLGGNIQSLSAELENLDQVIATEQSRGKTAAPFIERQEEIKKQIEFLKFMQRQEAQKLTGPGSLDARDLQAMQAAEKPQVPFVKPPKDTTRQELNAWRREMEFRSEKAVELEEMAAKDTREAWDIYTKGRIEQDEELRKAQQAGMKAWLETIDMEQELAIEAGRAYLESSRAMEKQIKKTDEFAKSLGLTFTSAFEDAIVEGRKLSDVLKGLEKDIARIIIRKSVTEPLANAIAGAIGGVFGGGGEEVEQLSGPGRAFGGPVSAGGSYMVGEHGPEVFTPSVSGMITSGESSITVVNNNYIDSRTDQASIALMMKATEDRTVAKIRQMQQRTGDPRV